MLTEIKNLHTQLNHDECIRVILARDNYEVHIDRTDILKTTKSGMLRIARKDGRITSVNPSFIVMVCTINKRSVLL